MINKIKDKIKLYYEKIITNYINFLNHKFKKYIIKYEEYGDKLKVYNSLGNYKVVENNIVNKVKIMTKISSDKELINNKINYYNSNKDDYKIIFISSSLLLMTLGSIFVLSCFLGSYILLIISLFAFSISLYFYSVNTYKLFLFREEIIRLNNIVNNKIILNNNELKELIIDTFTIIKNYFYNVLEKIIILFDNVKIKLRTKY